MLIYLDSNLVQYCADYEDFLFGNVKVPVRERKLYRELNAMKRLIDLDQITNLHIAASPQLLNELLDGKPTLKQREVYTMLTEAWKDTVWEEVFPIGYDEVKKIEISFRYLGLTPKDLRHLSEAIALKASYFFTNDGCIIRKCKKHKLPIRVSKPSECIEEISQGLILK